MSYVNSFHDNHVHFHGDVDSLDMCSKFKKSGGTSLNLVTTHMEQESLDFIKTYIQTIQQSNLIRSRGISTYITLGPHPDWQLDYFRKFSSIEKSEEKMISALDSLQPFIDDGIIDCIGEIGLPTRIPENIFGLETEEKKKLFMRSSLRIMKYAFVLAKDNDLPIMIHQPSSNQSERLYNLSKIAREIGYSRKNVMQHFCKPLLTPSENFGITPSIISFPSHIKKLKRRKNDLEKNNFFLETDYMDLECMKDKVCPISSVPSIFQELISEGFISRERSEYLSSDFPSIIYRGRAKTRKWNIKGIKLLS